MLAPWMKSYDQPRQHIKKQRHHFANKCPKVKSMVFLVVMYRCEIRTIKKADCQRIDAFELWYWRRLLRTPWIEKRLELDMEEQIGSKLEKEYVKAVYCHPAYLTCMQSTSCKMPGWMKHKLESRLPGEISIT